MSPLLALLAVSGLLGWLALVALAGPARAYSLAEPWTLTSENGVLEVFLVDRVALVEIAGAMVYARCWNDSFVAPILRVKRGDAITLKLQNDLGEPTNMHFHGFLVSPNTPHDNVLMSVDADTTFVYTITVEQTQEQGLYWYHSHQMGYSENQVFEGMSAPIVIEGLTDPFPSLTGIRDIVVALRDIQIRNGSIPAHIDMAFPTQRLVNGEINPSAAVSPGETVLLRIANVGADLFYRLAFIGSGVPQRKTHKNGGKKKKAKKKTKTTTHNKKQKHKKRNLKAVSCVVPRMHILALDGVRKTKLVEITDDYLLGPGSRMEVLVQFPPTKGTACTAYNLFMKSTYSGPVGTLHPATTLATFLVDFTRPLAPIRALPQPNEFPSILDLRTLPVNTTRTLVFSQNAPKDQFFINGLMVDAGRTDITVKLGSLERWILENDAFEEHIFHIHQGNFQVVKVNGQDVEFTGYQDTVNMDFKLLAPTTVEVLIPFFNPVIVGKYVFHCHVLQHEEVSCCCCCC